MLKHGISKESILKTLTEKLKNDYQYDSGFILGSMCSYPQEFGKEIYVNYLDKNLGDPGLFPGTAAIEKELIDDLGSLYNGQNITGSITSGGSEANLIAMRVAKNLRPDIINPEIIVPASAHASFYKGEDLMNIKIRTASLSNYQLDLEHFESLINKNTCGVVGIAGSSSLGIVDPIKEIAELIEGKNIYFHIDAAFGGFVLPFLELLDYNVPVWDFRIKELNSITSDPHKMGLGIIPSGGFLIREPEDLIYYEIPYLAGGDFKHLSILGTRPDANVIAFWAILKHLGINGFKKIIKNCMENTNYLAKKLSDIEGIKLAAKPMMNLVGFTTEDGTSISIIDDELRKKNWMLGKFDEFNLIRIVVMPHVKKEHLSNFIDDLERITKHS